MEQTVFEMLQDRFGELTRAERQLAGVLLDNYPLSGLGRITEVAGNARVSPATVARMVQKLGFGGFPEFQAALRAELEARISDPITKSDADSRASGRDHILHRFAEASVSNIRQTLELIDVREFDETCRLLLDPARSVHLVGGRITRSLAEHLHTHLQMIRGGLTLLPAAASAWPSYALDMCRGDVLVVYDVRRYENDVLHLAETAAARGVEIVLFTDRWASPVLRHATRRFFGRTEVPSAWDSTAAILVAQEALIARAQECGRPATRRRMESLEGLFDKTGLFKKFK